MLEKASRNIQAGKPAGTIGVGDFSTQPASISSDSEIDLPIEFGRYRLIKQLGEGGMGVVYLAHDIELDRKVALKLPHISGNRAKGLVERFRREARLSATLDHINICRVFDFGEYQGRLYLTMAFVEGKSLHEIIKIKGAIESRTAVTLLKRIANAVQFAHDRGIIHRDLKPANIMIKKDRDFVIMDFGLARRIEQADEQLTAAGAVLGTPAYMAPELLRGENEAVGPQSDVYSLGLILHELLTGKRLYQGTLPQIYAQVLNSQTTTLNSSCHYKDRSLDAIFQKATSAEISERFKSAGELAAALGGYLSLPSQNADLGDQSQPTKRKPQIHTSLPPTRPNTMMLVAGGVSFLAILFCVVVILFRKPDGTSTELRITDGPVSVGVKNDDGNAATKSVADVHSNRGDSELANAKAEAEPARTEATAARAELEKLRDGIVVDQPAQELRREEAIANIARLGGKIEYQNGSKEEPINSVSLENERFTDDDLVNLEPLNEALVVKIASSAITDAGLIHLKGMTRVRDLSIVCEQIDGAGDFLSELKHLRVLTLNGTQVGDTALRRLLQGMPGLTEIYLRNCPITDSGLEYLKRMSKLSILDLSFTKITNEGLKRIGIAPSMTRLFLDGIQIKGDGLTGLVGATNLFHLVLSETTIDDEGLKFISSLPSIQVFYLFKTSVSDAGLAHLKSLPQLRVLDVRETKVTDAGLEHLKSLSNLRLLIVMSTRITEAGIKRLQESIPELKSIK